MNINIEEYIDLNQPITAQLIAMRTAYEQANNKSLEGTEFFVSKEFFDKFISSVNARAEYQYFASKDVEISRANLAYTKWFKTNGIIIIANC